MKSKSIPTAQTPELETLLRLILGALESWESDDDELMSCGSITDSDVPPAVVRARTRLVSRIEEILPKPPVTEIRDQSFILRGGRLVPYPSVSPALEANADDLLVLLPALKEAVEHKLVASWTRQQQLAILKAIGTVLEEVSFSEEEISEQSKAAAVSVKSLLL